MHHSSMRDKIKIILTTRDCTFADTANRMLSHELSKILSAKTYTNPTYKPEQEFSKEKKRYQDLKRFEKR
jgi:hypothetical protein